LGNVTYYDPPFAGISPGNIAFEALDAPGVTTSTTYTVRVRSDDNVTAAYSPYKNNDGAMVLEEIMA
jgi:hypothetical protein